jgi:integrase
MASIKEHNGKWRVRITRKGVSTSKVFYTEKEAKDFAAETEADILNAHAKAIKKQIEPKTFEQVVSDYFDSQDFLSKADSTQKTERVKAKSVLTHFGSLPITQIDYYHVRDYLRDRAQEPSYSNGKVRNKKVSSTTVRLEKAFLSSVFNFAIDERLVAENPFRQGKIKIKKTEQDKRTLLPEEHFTILQHLCRNPTATLFFSFCAFTGARVGEASRIQKAWVNLKDRTITIPGRFHKNGEPKVILLAGEAFGSVRDQFEATKDDGSPFLFSSRKQKTGEFQPFKYASPWRNALMASGLEKIAPNLTRHTFITEAFLSSDLTPAAISQIAGHKDLASIKPYTHLTTRRYRQDAEKIASSIADQRNAVFSKILQTGNVKAGVEEISDEEADLLFQTLLERVQKRKTLNKK